MISKHPRKQRKMLYNAPLHKKRKWIVSHLAENLLLKYDRRSLPVIRGDTVKVMRGSFRGHEDKVAEVNIKNQTVEIEGIMITKADGKKLARQLHPSTLLITKLNLTDKWRRKKLEKGLSETAKKEVEQEAAEQLKERERAKAEEERKKKEDEAKIAEEIPEEVKETGEKKEPVIASVPTEPEEKKKEGQRSVEKKQKEPVKKTTKKPAVKIPKKEKEGET